ncbi:hypothetical protein EC973_000142 [Apophysomyces ossiformis]|uniref:RlpA-like protein double-psi beta-barrel domain-containing protein n=1 Tax=Apophysomyces ossiformis TaxID=679940 RepID=A0A8H7EUR1_9FUNG|nr:hypothetical protein EC973_000142 [Apophysomyces ossiformis]
MVRILPVAGLLATVAATLTAAAPTPAPVAHADTTELASMGIQVLTPDVIVDQPTLEKRGKHKKDKKKNKKNKKNKNKKNKDKKKKKHDDEDDEDEDDDHKHNNGGSSSGSGSGSGKVYTGRATFFHPATEGGAQGSCGPFANDNSLIVALNRPQYGDEDSKSKWCGKKVRVTGAEGSMVVTITDVCPNCKHGDLDLTPRVFREVVGPFKQGVGKISWQEV